MNKVLNAALKLAAKGYPVFPISPGQKMPIKGVEDEKGRGGFYAATLDASLIKSWFTQHPEANLAISTEGLLVVDVDPVEDGPNPYLKSEAFKVLAGVPASRTPRGGYHFFLRPDDGETFRNTAGHLAAKVDTRADGGYVLVAPSHTSAGSYVWGHPLPDRVNVPPVPHELRIQLRQASKTAPEEMGVHQTMLATALEGVRTNKGVIEIFNACRKIHKGGHRSDDEQKKIDKEISRILKHAYQKEAAHGALQARLDFHEEGDSKTDDGPAVAAFTTRLERREGERKKPLVGDLIADPSFGVVSAPPNIGKTAIAVGLTRCIADGVPLFNNPRLAPKRTGSVVVVELENDIDWADREVAFDHYHKQEAKHEVLVCNTLNLNDNNSIRAFLRGMKEQIAQYGMPLMMIVDTYGMVIAGANENSASDISPIINFFKQFKNQGTSVVLLHHPTKSGSSAVRGAALRGAVDFVLTVEDKGSHGTKEHLVYHRELAVDKQRGGRKDQVYPFKMVIVRGVDRDQAWDAVVVDTWEPELPAEMFDPLTLQVLMESGMACSTLEGIGRQCSVRDMWNDHKTMNGITTEQQGSKAELTKYTRKLVAGVYAALVNSGHWQLVEEKECKGRFPWLDHVWEQTRPLIMEDEDGDADQD